jgi:hypothetical protein
LASYTVLCLFADPHPVRFRQPFEFNFRFH